MDKTGMDGELIAFATQVRLERQLTEELERACRLVRRDGIAAVHVVPGRRPSFHELLQIRDVVASSALRMTVHGDGSLTVRPRVPVDEFVTEGPSVLSGMHQRRPAQRLTGTFGKWHLGFQGLAEGTR